MSPVLAGWLAVAASTAMAVAFGRALDRTFHR